MLHLTSLHSNSASITNSSALASQLTRSTLGLQQPGNLQRIADAARGFIHRGLVPFPATAASITANHKTILELDCITVRQWIRWSAGRLARPSENPRTILDAPSLGLYNDFSLSGGSHALAPSFPANRFARCRNERSLPTLAHAAEDDKSLPPAIAALHTLRGEAKPITVEERTDRQEKARRLMRDNNLSAILLAQGTSLAYFTGIRWEGGERLFAMVLPAKGEAFYVSPAFEEGRAREQIAQAPMAASPTSASGKKTRALTPA